MISLENFFSAKASSHPSLWQEEGPIWGPLFHLESYLKSLSFEIQISVPEGVFLQNKATIFIGEGTEIEPGVLIQGPCYIGKNCKIHHGAFLRGNVIMEEGSLVGHASEVKHSLLLKHAKVTHFCYVGDSIIGPNVNLGAGVKCSNLRLDGKDVSIRVGKERVETGLRKMGAVVGEGVQIGCNSVLNPGTLIGKNSFVYPLVNVGGLIRPQTKIRKDS